MNEQVERMQREAFNTPGVGSPLPPTVLMGATALLSGHWLLNRLLRLHVWQGLLALLLGGAAGASIFWARLQR